jgi:hypothetical protein
MTHRLPWGVTFDLFNEHVPVPPLVRQTLISWPRRHGCGTAHPIRKRHTRLLPDAGTYAVPAKRVLRVSTPNGIAASFKYFDVSNANKPGVDMRVRDAKAMSEARRTTPATHELTSNFGRDVGAAVDASKGMIAKQPVALRGGAVWHRAPLMSTSSRERPPVDRSANTRPYLSHRPQ